VCLLIALHAMFDDAPLVVAANRDERYERPAEAMTVLADHPRVLGGRDAVAGGTWLAVNELGVVAGLTNRPQRGGRDPSKRSRGELPLAFARWPDARRAVDAEAPAIDPTLYNPCWLLVGDRQALFAVDVSGGDHAEVHELGPGAYVLENRPLGAPSAKVLHTQEALVGLASGPDRSAALARVLADHTVPEPLDDEAEILVPSENGEGAPRPWPPELGANCVHTDGYGTRSALIVTVPAAPGHPTVEVADGPPCSTGFVMVDALWQPPAEVTGPTVGPLDRSGR